MAENTGESSSRAGAAVGGRGGPVAEERTIGQLVAEATVDLSEIVRAEIALAKAELTVSAKNGAIAGGLFGAAGYLAMLASITLTIAVAYVLLALGLPAWAAFGIITLALLLIAGVLTLIGRSRVRKVSGPELTIRSTKQTLEAVKPGATPRR